YGTTSAGGTYGSGTVFELSPIAGGGWTEHVLYSFGAGSQDGVGPSTPLVFDGAGHLYGTTEYGGPYYAGAVFELTPSASGSWTEALLHTFGYGQDGQQPLAGLVLDAHGDLYGTTVVGGTNDCLPGLGCGVAFEVINVAA